MDHRLWSTAGGICLAFFLDAAGAERTDWEDSMRERLQPSYDSKWKRLRSRTHLSTGAIVGIAVAVVAVVVSVFLCCCHRRRRRRILATQQHVVHPAMVPPMPGVAPYACPGSCPPVPVVAPYPAQYYHQHQAAQHAQMGLHAGHNLAAPSPQPSTLPMPSPTAPPEPPPPYNYRANYPH
ncbi:uncharacterized protein LOC142560500 [Dermacentor variabilis]|uniref:uncharacterized protein LOC142560500 n=1 Tax=Dermacentor variabilis TaxID=34621 RepID=UPI003F5C64D1